MKRSVSHLRIDVPHQAAIEMYSLEGVRVKHVNGVLPQAGRVAVWVEVDEDAVAAYNRFKAAHGICGDEVAVSTGPPYRRPSPVVILIIKFDGSVCCFTRKDMETVVAEFSKHTGAVVVKHDYTIKGHDVMAYLRVEPQFPTKSSKDAASKNLAAQIVNSSNPAFKGQPVDLTMGTATLHAYQVSPKYDVYPSRKGKTVRGVRKMPCHKCRQRVVPVVTAHDPYYVPDAACVVKSHGTAVGTPREGAGSVVQCAPTPPMSKEAFDELYTFAL